MSVIAGIVRFSGDPVRGEDLALSAARLALPGVGAAATWLQGGVGLLVRQRVVTPEDLAERQPWVGAGGRLVLIYDGRLDNRPEVVASLGLSLGPGEVMPDGLLLMKAFERWEKDAFQRIIGDFALALWDTAQHRLLLATDHMGLRPLYYHHGRQFVAFATTFPALLALPGVPRQINELKVADHLILNAKHPVETFYKGVLRVPMASYALFNENGVGMTRYWQLDPTRRIRLASDNDYIEAGRELLDRAVACRLRALKPVAATMSGGLDSSSVASTAARLLTPQTLQVVTCVTHPGVKPGPVKPDRYVDETPYVTAIAAMHSNMVLSLTSSASPHVYETDPTPFFDKAGIPTRSMANLGWFFPAYQKVLDAGSTALLGGEMGNAVWSWDGLRGLCNLARRGQWITLARELSYLNQQQAGSGYKELRRNVLGPLVPFRLRQFLRKIRNQPEGFWHPHSGISPGFAKEHVLLERCRQTGFDPSLAGSSDGQGVRLHMISTLAHQNDIRSAIRSVTGIEMRSPLLDIRLAEYCLAVPHNQYLRKGITRRFTRQIVADRLPDAVIHNNRAGMQNPEWFSRVTMLRQKMIADIERFKSSHLASSLLDLPRLWTLLEQWPKDAAVAHQLEHSYRYLLPRAIHAGCFLLWAERGGIVK